MITKPLISESSKADAIIQSTSFENWSSTPYKDLIDYHCITHRFWHTPLTTERLSQSSAMPLSELIFDFFQCWTEINEPPFWSWQTCIQIRCRRIDVEIFSVILGKISSAQYIGSSPCISNSSKSIFQTLFHILLRASCKHSYLGCELLCTKWDNKFITWNFERGWIGGKSEMGCRIDIWRWQ